MKLTNDHSLVEEMAYGRECEHRGILIGKALAEIEPALAVLRDPNGGWEETEEACDTVRRALREAVIDARDEVHLGPQASKGEEG